MSRLRAALLCAAALLTGCSQYRLVGKSCEDGDCARSRIDLPPPGQCGQQFVLAPARVPAGGRIERCALFTLDGLTSPPGSDRAYITDVDVESGPFSHDLDLRIAAELDDRFQDDDDVKCADLASTAIPWLPLMTTYGETNPQGPAPITDPRGPGFAHWSFGDAPLVVGTKYRLYVNDSFINLSAREVAAGVTINVTCVEQKPAMVSQTFEMSTGTGTTLHVPAGVSDAKLEGNCSFQQDVIVSRLYRRTRLISGFLVTRFDDDVMGEVLWPNNHDWVLDLDPPLTFRGGEDLFWRCEYRNDGDMEFEVKGNSADACALFGLYRLPDGREDPVPDHCRR
jgi:hypothetical protein